MKLYVSAAFQNGEKGVKKVHIDFWKDAPTQASFSFLLSLQLNITIIQQVIMKMYVQYPVSGFDLNTFSLWVSSLNH